MAVKVLLHDCTHSWHWGQSIFYLNTQRLVKTVKPVKKGFVKQINSLERNTNLSQDFLEQTLYSIYIIII